MRILYWTPEFYPAIGGIEELSRRTLPVLQKRYYDLLVVTSHGHQHLPDVTDFNGIPVHRFHFREALGSGDCKRILICQQQIARLKRSFEPDIVHLQFGDPYGFFHATTATAYSAVSLITVHSVVGPGRGDNTLLAKLLGGAAWVVGVSKAVLARARGAVPSIVNRSSVIYNGLETPALTAAPLNFDQPRILCLGRVVFDKGFDLAVAAFAEVRKRFPASQLIIAGDGPVRARLEQQTAALGLTEAVDFLGWVDPDGVPRLINQATIVVVPSRCHDSFPLVALQAAQMERPVVAARAGGLPEAVIHGETGLLVEREEPAQLASAIIHLLANPDIASRFGRSARTRAAEMFSFGRYLDAYDRLYTRLAAGAPTSQHE